MIYLLQEYEEGYDFTPVRTLTDDVFYIKTIMEPVPEIYVVTDYKGASCTTIMAWLSDNLDRYEYDIDIKDARGVFCFWRNRNASIVINKRINHGI